MKYTVEISGKTATETLEIRGKTYTRTTKSHGGGNCSSNDPGFDEMMEADGFDPDEYDTELNMVDDIFGGFMVSDMFELMEYLGGEEERDLEYDR